MRRIATTFLLMIGLGMAVSPNIRAQEGADPDPRKLEHLLKVVERNLGRLKTLDGQLRRIDHLAAGGEDEFAGRIMFGSPDLVFLDFQKVVANGRKPAVSPHERIVCTGREVWHYQPAAKQITVGPQAFTIPMRVEEAKRRYEINLIGEDQDSFTVKFAPKLPLEQQFFSQAIIRFDRRQWWLPTRISITTPDQNSTRELILSGVEPNKPLAVANFEGRAIRGWEVRNVGGGVPLQPRR